MGLLHSPAPGVYGMGIRPPQPPLLKGPRTKHPPPQGAPMGASWLWGEGAAGPPNLEGEEDGGMEEGRRETPHPPG